MLRIENLNIRKDDRVILREIGLAVNPHEIYGILGPNGAGKSSLAYAIMGCNGYRPCQGKIIFDGKEITDLPIWERARLGITLAWQHEARFEGITVEDYLLLGMKEVEGGELVEALKNVLLDPKEYLKRKVDKTLSGGERQMLAIARSLMSRPKLILLDEPSSGLAPLIVTLLFQFVDQIKMQGYSILMVEQNVRKAIQLCDRAYLLESGRVKLTGDRDSFSQESSIRQAYIGI